MVCNLVKNGVRKSHLCIFVLTIYVCFGIIVYNSWKVSDTDA